MKESRWPLVAALAVLIVHGCVVLRSGVSLSPDAVEFSRRADLLLANHFNFAAASRAIGVHNVPAAMYMLFIAMVALAKIIAGAKWAAVIVAANLCFDALTAAILVWLVRLATRSNAASVLAIVAWLLCFDIVTWVRMPLTDVPFLLGEFCRVRRGRRSAPRWQETGAHIHRGGHRSDRDFGLAPARRISLADSGGDDLAGSLPESFQDAPSSWLRCSSLP